METKSVTTGFMSALLACSAGAILVVQTAETAGLSKAELISWFSSVYVFGGVLNLFLTLKYKIPFAGAHSITAVAFISTVAAQFSFPELAGGFVMSGALILLAGSTGLFAKALNLIPKQLIDALLSGLILSYVIGIVPAVIHLPIAGLLSGIGYFLIPRMTRLLSPVMWALLFGLLGLGFEFDFPALIDTSFLLPLPIIPKFTIKGFISIAIPMSVLIMSNDLAVALASLKSHEFDPPVNRVLAATGVASMIAGLYGGHSANVGGMMSALCSSHEAGSKESRHWAALVSSGVVICYGLLAWKVIELIEIMPSFFVEMMTGFSLLGLFHSGLRSSFSNKGYLVPALLTFAIAAAHVNMLGISTPIWSLVVGMAAIRCSRPGRERNCVSKIGQQKSRKINGD
ncbi:benzoate/H(+) symporter BenE family transporter [Paenibacillus filicis]|uniref:Benzoate/H(+) symporter BenE family transporter n=1 Tax=Paenibacillus gyeongsangnamensis TaxID=3388067 RepID=A0ABT4Q4G3_9BACL|nr:benzoate/H(+) symporter BenE family transporter [Paenibacillus filicis]MCZ8511742.1 benzoate/H(+) symporter BenE family transporter [Paenibacillus filicis]